MVKKAGIIFDLHLMVEFNRLKFIERALHITGKEY